MTTTEIIAWSIGFALPILAAPVAVILLRHLFAMFLTEGIELFGTISLAREDALVLGSMMAKLNVAVLLVAWLALFTCTRFEMSPWLCMAIALTGLTAALLLTMGVIRTNLGIHGNALIVVGMLAYAGGNLPIIIVVGALLALLPKT